MIDPTDRSDRPVAVIGAGAAGTLAAARLLERGLPVLLVDPAGTTGRGTAYATPNPLHRLNVPAREMSARPDDPTHFSRWLRRLGESDDGYPPRALYGRYLAEHLDSCGTPERLHDTVDHIVHADDGVRLLLGSGEMRHAGAVVLALGALPPVRTWVPRELAASDHYVADPWAPGALDRARGGSALLVGTGLTMVDVAISLSGVVHELHSLSRHGAVPQAHADIPAPVLPPSPALLAGADLTTLRHALLRHVAGSRRVTGDWRPALDGLRAFTPDLWRRLDQDERLDFLARYAHLWNTHRHRMAPATARRFAGVALEQHRGTVREGVAHGGRLALSVSDGSELRVDTVINCTGPQGAGTSRTLADGLIAAGLAVPDDLQLGLDTTADGRLIPRRGQAGAPIWALGALRRAEAWESNTIPELRVQAVEVADAVAGSVLAPAASAMSRHPSAGRRYPAPPARAPQPPARRAAPLPRDRYGLELHTGRDAAELYDRALERILLGQHGGDELLADALDLDPGFALAHAARALLGREGASARSITASLHAADRSLARADDDRERGLVDAISRHVTGDPRAGQALRRHLENFPRDVLALHVAVPTVSFDGGGARSGAEHLVESLAEHYDDDWYFAGQLAHVRQQQRRYDAAERLAERALAEQPGCTGAAHARAHVFYETGQHDAGLAWLDGWLRRHGAASRGHSHLSWHASLHELANLDTDAAERRFHAHLAGPSVTSPRSLVDVGALLWRGQVVGAGPTRGAREAIATAPAGWVEAPPTPFVGLHVALTLAAADDTRALRRLREHALRRQEPVLRDVVAPLAHALTLVLERRWPLAIDALRGLLPHTEALGASRAQTDVIEETLLFAYVQGGRLVEATDLLALRLDRRPSYLDQRRLGALSSARRRAA